MQTMQRSIKMTYRSKKEGEMSKQEVISLIRRNEFKKTKAVRLISDFLAISLNHATIFYEVEILHMKEVEQ